MNQINHLFTCIFGFNFISVDAYPILSETINEAGLNSFYITILVVLVLSATFLAGCLCCKRKKGFQEFSPRARNNVRGNIEFSNPLSTVNTQSEITLFPPSGSLPIMFDPLPPLTPKHEQVPAPNPRPAAFTDALTKGISVQAWFQEPQDNFPRQQLHYLRECGRGWFGRVVEGEARGILPNGRTSRVIVRILREGATESEQKFFLHEAKPYKELSHPNILRLFGRCLENDPFLLLFEACNGGDLKSWLSQNIASRETLTQQGITMRMAADIASGLAHMNHHGFVHTDLAARNVLVTSDLRIKVGDYGTSFETFKDDYYCLGVVALPIRWCAPETLLCTDTTIEMKEVTAPANVWNFGVVLWEICEFGKLPYTDLSDDQVIVRVLGNERARLPEPSFPSPFKNHLYYLMQLCWRNYKERPSISHILSMLNHLLTSKIKTQNDMDDFERRWENMKPNTVPKTDNHTPTMSEDRVKSDNDSGVVLDNKHSAFAGSEMDLSSKKLLAESSSSMTISPQLSVTSSSGGEFFSQTSSPIKLKSPSLQNLQGSLEEINEAVGRSEEGGGLDLWLQNIEIKNEKDAKLVSGVYKAINDLDTALSLEKTSSSNESSCYDSPSLNRKSSAVMSQNLVPEFKLGPFVNTNFHMDRRLKFQPDSFQDDSFIMRKTGDSSGTDTEDEIWRRRIERGEFSEKVKEKSKSIADLMVLTHIDNSDGSESDSMPSFSFSKIVRQNTKNNALASSIGFGSDKCIYSSLTAEQSDCDLKKFQNALKKKDMDDPSLNFLRRDSLSYFINNPNFKFSDSSSNSSSNFQQTDHFLEIRASEKTSNALKTTSTVLDSKTLMTPLTSAPEIRVSSCEDVAESPADVPNVFVNVKPKKFKFVVKEESETSSPAPATSVTRDPHVNGTITNLVNAKPTFENHHSDSNQAEKIDPTPASVENLSVNNVMMPENSGQGSKDFDLTSNLTEKDLAPICHHIEDYNLYNVTNISKNSRQSDKEYKSDPDLASKLKTLVIGDLSENKNTDPKFLKNSQSDPIISNSQTCTSIEEINKEKTSEDSQTRVFEWNEVEKKENEQKMFSFELGDSGIIIDEPSENSQFILPISCESKLESSVILGSCEDFTLDLYKGLKTCSGGELNTAQENEEGNESETVLARNRKNELNEKCLQEDHRNVKNDDSDRNCDRIFIETVDDCEFVPENKDDYSYNRFYEDHSDDAYVDSGKSSDVLDDENYELKAYTSYSNLADQSYFSQESKEGDDYSNEPELCYSTCIRHPNSLSHSTCVSVSNENLEAVKLLTPDDEKSSDTGFRDKSSPSESYDDMCNEKYNLEDIENELEDGRSSSSTEYPERPQKVENKIGVFVETKKTDNGSVFSRFGETGPEKVRNFNNNKENFITEKNSQQVELDNSTSNCVKDTDTESLNEKDAEKFPHIIQNGRDRCIGHREEEEPPPPSYEEYERLHADQVRLFRMKQKFSELEDSSPISDDDNNLHLSLERCDSVSSIDSDGEGHESAICEGGSEGWYLHSRSPQRETLHSNWLPESISGDDNRNETVSEEYLMAIRNELNEKLLKIHLPGLSFEREEETVDDDLIICDDSESKRRSRKGQDIFIQYNSFSDYLSPIVEEDENGCSSISSPYSDSSDLSRTLSLNTTEKEVIDPVSDSAENQRKEQENDEVIEVNTETNEIRMIESPRSSSQLSASLPSEEPVTEQLESVDQCSEYSVDSISPVTGSPSATNPNATCSSLNENLSEVFLSPNSAQSDLTFADDKTICSEPDEDCETDVEEATNSLSSPTKEPEVLLSSEGTPPPVDNQQSDVMRSINDLLAKPRSPGSNLSEMKVSPENQQTDEWLKSVLLPSPENPPPNSNANSFEASNWPNTQSLTPVLTKGETMKSTVDHFSDNNSAHVNHDSGLTSNFLNAALNSHPVENTHTESHTSQSPVRKNQVDLNSTLAFETPIPETGKSFGGDRLGGSGINNAEIDTSCDSLENYKNYCRKKFKITKVDENVKPLLCESSGKKLSESKNSQRTIVNDEELNKRLNEINKEAQDRLEISVQTNEPSVPLPSPSEQNGISIPSTWPVSPQLFDLKNIEKLSLTEIDTSDDQMMSTSFIDSNSAENSETEENIDSDTNWNGVDSAKKSTAAFDDGDFWCESSEFNVPSRRQVEEEDEDENDDDYDDEDDEDTADFVPSSWNSQATPVKSVLKSPETRSEQKKNVSFKRQRYHCVYEYPKEEQSDSEEEANHSRFSPLINFDFSEYTDWEMGLTDDGSSIETTQDSETEVVKPSEKHDVYALTPIDKDFSFNSSLEDDEFFISSSTRPFKNDQGSLNCQFFPGKTYLEENFTPLAADINEENGFEKL